MARTTAVSKRGAVGVVHQCERVLDQRALQKMMEHKPINISSEKIEWITVGGGFYKANERCYGCGAPMLTNGKSFECEFCGGGIIEKS